MQRSLLRRLSLLHVIVSASSSNATWRDDGKCSGAGLSTPLFAPDGASLATCNPNSNSPCCSKWGFCGSSADHCDCADCVDFRPWRQDGKCSGAGLATPLFARDNITLATCDPYGASPCCSKWGFCGSSADHCDCADCVNFRAADYVPPIPQTPWVQRVCGGTTVGQDGTTTPAQCDPDSDAPCCGPTGLCGIGDEFCRGDGAVDYRRKPWTTDGSCGGNTIGSDGFTTPAQCDPTSDAPCCSKEGACGGTVSHCACDGCVDHRPRYRFDGKCGPSNPGEQGNLPGECDPASGSPCCSPYGEVLR